MITFKELNKRVPRKKGQPANSKKHSDLVLWILFLI